MSSQSLCCYHSIALAPHSYPVIILCSSSCASRCVKGEFKAEWRINSSCSHWHWMKELICGVVCQEMLEMLSRRLSEVVAAECACRERIFSLLFILSWKNKALEMPICIAADSKWWQHLRLAKTRKIRHAFHSQAGCATLNENTRRRVSDGFRRHWEWHVEIIAYKERSFIPKWCLLEEDKKYPFLVDFGDILIFARRTTATSTEVFSWRALFLWKRNDWVSEKLSNRCVISYLG